MDAVLTVVRELHAEHAIFVGWSLGGHLLLEATDRLPRARGFMIFGTPPLGAAPTEETPFTTHPATGLIFKSVLTEEEKNTYLTSIFSPETKTIPPMFREDLEKADGKVREVLGMLAAQASFEDEVAVVNNLPCPLAILHGSRDRLVNPDYIRSLSYNTLWKGKIIDIPGTGHTPQWEHPVLFNSVLTEFDASL
jgi:pimeloyl-ACP methyl ester carboxylesterase